MRVLGAIMFLSVQTGNMQSAVQHWQVPQAVCMVEVQIDGRFVA